MRCFGAFQFQLIFEGEVGTGQSHQSDIALDDIVVTEGLCPIPKPPPTPNPCLRKCKDSRCVPSDKVCDFYPDCAQGSDPNDDSDEHGCDGCDFEKGNCYYNDTSKGNFKWFRKNGRTTSYLTGPSTDHTKGDSNGYYVYVEASVGKNYDLATFNSPTLKQAAATCTMNFWYHMFGTSIGELNIYIVQGYRMTNLWTQYGDQGNKWVQGTVYLNRRPNPFSVQFVATRSNSFQGDIAIDDISFQNCALPAPAKYCNTNYQFRCMQTRACVSLYDLCDFTDDCGDGSDELNCNYLHYPYRCDFEWGLCSWYNLNDDDFDFTRSKGHTDSYGTGPGFDHTTLTSSGYYLYAEASWPRKKGDITRLVSGTLSSTTLFSRCNFRFYYHMSGSHIGTLRIKTRECIGCQEHVWWMRDTEEVNNWIRSSVLLYSEKPFQVIIEAELGDGYQGDISIDDVSFEGCSVYYGPLPTAVPTTTTTTVCMSNQIYCSADAKCIDGRMKCDHRNDCSDGEDEIDCGSCDFEKDMCGYMDQSYGIYEFLRSQPLTDGTVGAPKVDATTKSSKGWFAMTVDSTSFFGSSATLQSKPMMPTAPECEVRFSYYHNKTVGGTTSITVKTIEDWGINTTNVVYSDIYQKFVDSVDEWKSMTVGVGSRPSGWRLQIEAASKHVGIDDIELVNCALPRITGSCYSFQVGCDNGACVSSDQVCDFSNDCGDYSDEKEVICSKSYPERCNFEQDTCNWYQDQNDDIEWTRTQGQGTFYLKVPGVDHTQGNSKGWFMYVSTANMVKGNETARLLSPIFKATNYQGCAMRFHYHMYGNGKDVLSIKVRTSGDMSSPMKTVWGINGDQGNKWNADTAYIKTYTTFQVVIEATIFNRGAYNFNNEGYIAMDDISFSKECKVDFSATLNPFPLTPTAPQGCQSGEFSCGNGKCIAYDRVCDFVKDCADGYDESFCPSTCSFEDSSMCDWYNTYGMDANMRWKLKKADSASFGAGPKTDHTLGTSKGSYIYMEADVSKKQQYPTARLISPFYFSGAYNCDFSFFYNMYNASTSATSSDVRLNVYYRKYGRDTLLAKTNSLTLNQWKEQKVKLPHCPKDFNLVIEGTGFDGVQVDAALDDFAFACGEKAPQQCSSDQYQCKKTQQCISKNDLCDNERNCCDGTDEDVDTICKGYTKYDFEKGLGDWVQLKNDTFDFTIFSGRTDPAWNYGPHNDHTTQEEHGRYYYIDVSTRSKGDNASLASATLSPTTTCSMTFWYNMNGKGIGSLSAAIATEYGVPSNKIWAKSNDQGSGWKKATVVLNSLKDFQVIFTATAGVSTRGDIGIDDVIFTPECKFNGALLPGAPKPPTVDPCLPKFQCRLSGQCISASYKCDFVPDCPGGTDEDFETCGIPQGFEKSVKPWIDDFSATYHFARTNNGGIKTDARKDTKGYYLTLDSSNRVSDHMASIKTQVFGAAFSQCVMEFSYHVYGRNIGLFEIDLFNNASENQYPTKMFELKGDTGINAWQTTQVYIGRRKEPFYVSFTAHVGGNPQGVGNENQGDISIDEVNFKNCGHQPVCSGNLTGKFVCANSRCVDIDKVCDLTDDCGDSSDEQVASHCKNFIGCSFETLDADPCNMTQDKSDDFDWYLGSSYTPSYNTGPTRDHTYGTSSGHYWYIEASAPRKQGDKARLITLAMNARPNGTCSMRFFYHMNGNYDEGIRVYVLKDKDGLLDLRFKDTKSYGDMWKSGVVDLSKDTDKFRIVFEGVVGKTFRSDIAIDDVILSPDCITNSTRIFPTTIPCQSDQFTCRSSGQCVSKNARCDKKRDCKDGSDEDNCGGGSTGKQTGGGMTSKDTSILAGAVVAGLIVLLVIVMAVYLIKKRRSDKKLQLFSVFYDPTNPDNAKPSSSGNEKEKQGKSIKNSKKKAKSDEGVVNPIYDEDNMGEFSMGDVDTDMFPDDQFRVVMDSNNGATSMSNPLYRDPFMDEDEPPLSS